MMMKLHVRVGFEDLDVCTPATLSNPSPHEQPIETSQLEATRLLKGGFSSEVATGSEPSVYFVQSLADHSPQLSGANYWTGARF